MSTGSAAAGRPSRPRDASEDLVDVIDDDGHVERVVTRSEMRAGRLRHRCTFVLVRSSRGEVLIHRRSDHKDMWPGRWDITCGGVVDAGEDWTAAARRELAEELGITGTRVHLIELTEATYSDDDVDEVAKVWQIDHDGPFEFTDDEVVEALFVSIDDLRRRVGRDPFVPDSLALAGRFVFGDDAGGAASGKVGIGG